MVVCCKCNRLGQCSGCACVKAGKHCSDCLPCRLGNCTNIPPTNCTNIPSITKPNNSNPSDTAQQQQPATVTLPLTRATSSSFPLPEYTAVSQQPFTWGSLTGHEFTKQLDTIYEEVVHWRRNCFSVPLGKLGRDFVSELSRLYLAYGTASALESVALKAATVYPILLLQKPSKRSKAKEHIQCLER